MKLSRKFSFLQLLAAFSLVALLAGQAVSEEGKSAQPKPETKGNPEAAVKPDAAAKTSPTDPVAKVNDKVITRGEVDRAMKVFAAQSHMSQQPSADAVIDQLVSAELLYQAGVKLSTPDLDKQVAAKMAESKARFPNDAAFDNALKSANLSQKELEELIRRDLIISNLVDKEIASKVTVTDADVKKFYDDNIDKFKQGESIRASHILCGVDPKASDAEKKKAKEKAEALLKEIKAGKDFAELAKNNSTCPSKAQGGDLGFFGKGQMVPAFENAAFALKPGEVSNVVETQFGYHIIKVTDKKEAGVAKFDDVKERIRTYLKNSKIQKGVLDYVAQLKEKARIEKVKN
ncbi:MAG TPA: peptidylprolyl isomerase [Geobacteraceae bacterium]|nr:peptidylprolyl isomerase [Geobacteraceae bacterium]